MQKLLAFIIIISFFFCQNDIGNKDNSQSILLNLGLFQQRNNRLTVSGTAVKGLIKNGIVNVSPLGADGTCNSSTILAKGTTDSSGNYSLTYPKTGGVICLTVSSSPEGKTTMFDEKMNADVSIPSVSNFQLVTVIPESRIVNSRKNTMVSPFSKLLARRLETLIKQGGSGADQNALYKKASKEVVIRFGLQGGLSLASSRSILPSVEAANLSLSDSDYPELEDIILDLQNPSSPITAKFISILVGFSQLANKYKKGASISIDDIDSMVEAFASDFEDGVFDGKTASGASITVGSGSNQLTFSSSPLTTVLLPAMVSYFQEGGKLSVGGYTATQNINVSQITDQVQFVDSASIIATNSTNLVYTGSPFSFTQNSAVTPIIPTIVGTISNCASSPTLPVGLTLSSTCTISGTPTVPQANTSYTITATSASGNATAIISIAITSPTVPLTLAYTGSPFSFTQNTAITTISPISNGTISSCSSSPTLPAGLTLSSTCTISGTPTSVRANTSYTITANATSGNATTIIVIAVSSSVIPLTLSYSGSPFSFTQNTAITTINPTSNGTITSCSSSPTLPTGLTLSAACAISGTPTISQANTSYTITANGNTGAASAIISIAVNLLTNISYPSSSYTFVNGQAINIPATLQGGTVTSCASNIALPTGISLNSSTCALSGTPTVNQAATSYTISVTNAGGTASVILSIAITTPVSYTIGGTVSGMSGGTLVLRLNGANNLNITVNGGFTFGTSLSSGTAYTVSVFTNPAAYMCTLSNNTGTATSNLTNVSVTCSPNIIYVSTTGNDTTGNGSTANPYLTIQKGIDMAFAMGGGEVRVGAGVYTNTTAILIKSNVKLLGGYNATTWVRDIPNNITEIQDTTTGTSNIFTASSVAGPITIEGFKMSFTTLSAASVDRKIMSLSVSAAVTVANNDMTSPNSNNSSSYGIYLTGSTGHLIYNNIVRVKTNSGDTRYVYGIYTTVPTSIYNNVVYTGDNTVNGGSAIYLGSLDIRVRNNTIIFNNARKGIEIVGGTTGTANIENNIIYAPSAGGNCVYAATATQRPASLSNNSMFNCATNYYLESATPYSFATIGTAGIGSATGNLEYDMVTNSCFVNSTSDWHLQNGCAATVKTGGLDGSSLSWGFNFDRDNVIRTANWSIGAYENNN